MTSNGVIVPPYRPYESAWSWLHKFSDRNAASAEDIRWIVGLEKPRQWYASSRDLRRPGHWNIQKLTGWWGRPAEEAFVGAYLGATPAYLWESMTWHVLRYCEQCAEGGYHSPLFQIRGIARCPIHRTPLQTVCPRCQYPIPYRWSASCLRVTYGCPNCGTSLWPRQVTVRSQTPPSADGLSGIDDAWRWLQGASRDAQAAGEWGGILVDPPAAPLNDPDAGFVSYWRELYPPPCTELVCASSQPMLTARTRPTGRATLLSLEDTYAARLADLRACFKAYARHYRRRVLRYHVRCIRAATREIQICPLSSTDWFDTETVCPWAYAYIVWRMYWDATDQPSDVDRYPLGWQHYQPHGGGPNGVLGSAGYWSAFLPAQGDVDSRWLALHEAALAFRSTFEACCRLGSQFADANRMVWDPALVDDRCMPLYFKHRTTRQFCWWPSSDPLPNPNPADPHAHQYLTQQQIQRIRITMDKRLKFAVHRLPWLSDVEATRGHRSLLTEP